MSWTKKKLLAWGASYLDIGSFAGICLRSLLAAVVLLSSGLSHAQVLSVQGGTPLPSPRSGSVCLTHSDGRVFIFGKTPLDTTIVYDPVLDTYTPKAPMPNPTYEGCGAVAGDGTMVVFGGEGEGHVGKRSVRRYDPTLDSWAVSSYLDMPDSCAAATGPDGRVHVMGKSYVERHLIYDAALDTWVTAGPTLRKRWDHGAVFVGGQLYAFGGTGGDAFQFPPHPDAADLYLDVWDSSLGTWSPGPNLPWRHKRFGSVSDGVRIYLIGNQYDFGQSNLILEYDVAGQYWAYSPQLLLQGVEEGCAAITNGAIHVFGGSPSGTLHQILWLQPHCGNGNVDNGEDCDDAGESATCDVDCTLAICGDGQLNLSAGESCDEMGATATCDADCTAVVCGDGLANAAAGEVCDDGGASASCDEDCTPAVCGDGLLNVAAGEACDEAGASASCDADCSDVVCGDGVVNKLAGEVCDAGQATVNCDDDCTPAVCGDGHINTVAGETCDDGGPSATCNEDCTLRSCGDGVWNEAAGEVCDHGGETATCDADCTEVLCGDGRVNVAAGEACDGAGWTVDCDADCSLAACGDGQLNELAGEACDDGNRENGDGCDTMCAVEVEGMGGGDTGPAPVPSVDAGCACSVRGRSESGRYGWVWTFALVALVTRRRRTSGRAAAAASVVLAVLTVLVAPAAAWAQPHSWVSAPVGVLPEPRAEHTVVAGLDGRIYVFGGYADAPNVRTATAVSYVYDPTTQITSTIAPMPFPSRGHCSARAMDGRIVTFGGYDQSHLSVTQIYHPLTDTWTVGTSQSRGWGCAAATDDTGLIHVTGGESAKLSYDVYDPVLGTFTTMPSLPAFRFGHGSVFVSGRLLVIGGRQNYSSTQALDTVLRFDATTSTWVNTTPLPGPRTRAATTLHGTQVFVMGGFDAGGGLTFSFFTSNDAGQSWSPLLPPLGPGSTYTVANASAATTPGFLFWVGGQNASGPAVTMRNALLISFCGNGIAETGEDCDEGPLSPTCDPDCTAVVCGDGTVNAAAGEDCDTQGDSASCDADCTAPMCGDGHYNPVFGESCDDGGESASCDADCTLAECGDLTTNAAAGEDCDEGGETLTCNIDCTAAQCGDGVTNATAGELCDEAGASPTCDEDCTDVICGDGLVNVLAGETCDEGFESATCNANCTLRSCGDGVVNATAGEQCDDGGASATCDADCTFPFCGDGVTNTSAGEACDDKFATPDCDADCTPTECGDGTLNPTAEACDDGNLDDGDGCSAACQVETAPPVSGSGGATTTSSGGSGGSEPFEPEGGCSCSLDRPSDGPNGRGLGWMLLALGSLAHRRRWRAILGSGE